MTCASCATRIERTLNKVDGVDATVNFVTETATVTLRPGACRARNSRRRSSRSATTHIRRSSATVTGARTITTRRPCVAPARLIVALVLSVPLVLLAMVPPLRFTGWEWVSLVLATPVVFWSGAQFHRAALLNARHGAATMDTLVSIGTLAAWTWSAVVLLGGIDADGYFEVAAVITALILLGRYFEARAKRRSGAAIRALLELGAKEARVLRGGVEVLVPVEELAPGDLFVVRPGEKIATDGVVVEGASAIDQSMLTGRARAGGGLDRR